MPASLQDFGSSLRSCACVQPQFFLGTVRWSYRRLQCRAASEKDKGKGGGINWDAEWRKAKAREQCCIWSAGSSTYYCAQQRHVLHIISTEANHLILQGYLRSQLRM